MILLVFLKRGAGRRSRIMATVCSRAPVFGARLAGIAVHRVGSHPLLLLLPQRPPTCEEVVVVIAVSVAVQVGRVLPPFTVREVVLLQLVGDPVRGGGQQASKP